MEPYLFLGMIIAISSLITVVSVLALVLILWSFWANIYTRVPWAKTPNENIDLILDELGDVKGKRIYDLGCGDGRFLFGAEKRGAYGVGYELSLYPYLKAKLRNMANKSEINFKRKNFFKASISDADIVFVFLVKCIMVKTSEKLISELKGGTKIVSYGFEMPGMVPYRVVDTEPSKTFFYTT